MNDQMLFVVSLVCSNVFSYSKTRLFDKKRQMFIFLPLTNISVAIGLSFLLLSISAIKSLNTVNIFHF